MSHSSAVAPARSKERTGDAPKPSRPKAGPARRRIDGRRWAPLGFLTPFGTLFAITFVAPICYAVYESLYKLHRSGLGLAPPPRSSPDCPTTRTRWPTTPSPPRSFGWC